jgi:hypothetical protein
MSKSKRHEQSMPVSEDKAMWSQSAKKTKRKQRSIQEKKKQMQSHEGES